MRLVTKVTRRGGPALPPRGLHHLRDRLGSLRRNGLRGLLDSLFVGPISIYHRSLLCEISPLARGLSQSNSHNKQDRPEAVWFDPRNRKGPLLSDPLPVENLFGMKSSPGKGKTRVFHRSWGLRKNTVFHF